MFMSSREFDLVLQHKPIKQYLYDFANAIVDVFLSIFGTM